jgi:hypothetical protein
MGAPITRSAPRTQTSSRHEIRKLAWRSIGFMSRVVPMLSFAHAKHCVPEHTRFGVRQDGPRQSAFRLEQSHRQRSHTWNACVANNLDAAGPCVIVQIGGNCHSLGSFCCPYAQAKWDSKGRLLPWLKNIAPGAWPPSCIERPPSNSGPSSHLPRTTCKHLVPFQPMQLLRGWPAIRRRERWP